MDPQNETLPSNSDKQQSQSDSKTSNISTSICSNESWMTSGSVSGSGATVGDGDRFINDGDLDNDNTVSEELSRFSSPSQSQSSSCTSITNPFYDGPITIMSESTSGINASNNQIMSGKLAEVGGRINQRLPQSLHRKSSSVTANAGPRQAASQSTVVPNQIVSGDAPTASQAEEKIKQRVIIIWDLGYLLTCQGFLQFLQLFMTVAALVCLVSAGGKDGGLLNLPLSWHFRIMLFVLVLTLLVTVALLFGNVTSLISIFGFEWTFFDMVVYSLFAFLYLVGSSLVASAFDFYEKMKTDVSKETISQLVTSVILGYVCMLLNGFSAFISYRKWKIQYRLYRRRKLIEEDEIDL
ncbi:CKLF-like MARVEL transmembrane domain-containing protein 4 [Biomphalaria pfeifferi]|uniref:CKLF-like MARVEL transmembrane domain-containing protein 4 n=1 Tax=Biomphalaria pfeifferi TaxID=112525 RepID=A0AAD8B4G9_BIOPF|nr:CKLF-like MARVEL transmembrane domain-containing protein 4 [Biomphalaria pfeifferi]